MQGERQRFAVAYLCSILIHAIALLLLVVFVVRALAEGGAPESVIADTQLSVRTETAPPIVVPTPVPAPRVPLRPVLAASAPPRPPVPRELARIVPRATPEPPSPPPVALAEPTPVPTTRPTVAPTQRPTVPPTERPTVAPTTPPTVAPTARPTVAPTLRPTAEPTARATPEPTARPTEEPSAALPSAPPAATPAPAALATAVAAAPASSAAPARVAAAPTAAPAAPAPIATPSPVRVAAAPATPAPVTTSAGLSSLNDRLRAALPTKPTAGLQRVDLGSGYTANRVLDAYEAALAPPLAVLAKTFGLIYTTRTVARADSIEYVYERVHVLGIEVCRAYKITEHPLRPLESAPDVSKPGAVSFPGPLRDVKPEIETVEIPCDSPGMIKVEPGSITTPVPRRRP